MNCYQMYKIKLEGAFVFELIDLFVTVKIFQMKMTLFFSLLKKLVYS